MIAFLTYVTYKNFFKEIFMSASKITKKYLAIRSELNKLKQTNANAFKDLIKHDYNASDVNSYKKSLDPYDELLMVTDRNYEFMAVDPRISNITNVID